MSTPSLRRGRVHCAAAAGFALQPKRTMVLPEMPSSSKDGKDLPRMRSEKGRIRIRQRWRDQEGGTMQ